MWRLFLTCAVAAGLCFPVSDVPVNAEEQAKKSTEKPAAEQVRENPNDVKAWGAYGTESFQAVSAMIEENPKGALARLDAMEKFLAEVKPDTPAAKQIASRVESSIGAYREHIALSQTTLDELDKTLAEKPDDAQAINRYVRKATQQIQEVMRENPDEAAKQLEALKERLAKASDAATKEATKKTLASSTRSLASLDARIASARKLVELIGKDAAPLKVADWVNGTPLTDADLKGKVVFLDFWAVWCGPCIATFPHLKEWNEKYADKGLVMIGLTKYYNMKWDEDAQRATRATGAAKVAPEEEQEMLSKFAEHHDLKHRFAIQPDDTLSDYYGVTGIPHVVIIDQQGKVRMIRVGSGEKNAKDLEGMLQQLLEGSATGE